MTISIGSQCASGTALSATSLAMTYTASVPQTSPTDGIQLLIAYSSWSANPLSTANITDTATGGVGYNGFANGVIGAAMGVGTAGGFNGYNWWSSGMLGFNVINPITTSDVLTWDFGGVTIDYLRASVFPVHNALLGDCVTGVTFVQFGSNSWGGNGGSEPIAVSSGDTQLVAGVAAFAPSLTSFQFIDTSITMIDSWLNDGPNSDMSFICGYNPAIVTPDTFECGVTTTGPPLDIFRGGPIGPGEGGDGGSFYQSPPPDTGVAYCVMPAGNPLFNNRTRLLGPILTA